ncbi:MAG: hypothetical protein KDJ27_15260 [Gammaproteobacteria bacterium]|nr:hypothetical protein [Gammaproteobacteria bacterium]
MRAMLACLFALPVIATAAPWTFSEPVTVAGDGDHFHHLDGAGRRHVAAADGAVALVWEDDRSGAPQVYLATKPVDAADFGRIERLSDGTEAYEPAVVGLGGGRWLAAWEQDGGVVARLVTPDGLGEVVALARTGARQVTLAAGSDRIAAVWARDSAGGQLLETADITVAHDALAVAAPVVPAPTAGEHPYQGFPSAAWAADGALLIAWEDRRAGHTRIFATRRDASGAFASETQLNEHNAPKVDGHEVVGLGSGVMRVMLAADAKGGARAIWLDKRNAASGYAVWGAASDDNGVHYGANQIVQDEQGGAVQQWHAALASGRPGFVAAWDDTREVWSDERETGDVLLSWHAGDHWSEDLLVPGASGSGYQGSPALALDAQGGLHLTWIERDDLTSPSRLRYLQGRWQPDAQ